MKQKKFFLHSFFLSSLFYLFTFQGGNVQHEYYQTLILPSIAIFTGLGINYFFENKKNLFPLLSISTVFILFIFSWFFSFYKVKDYYQYSQELVQEANIIKSLTLPDDKIITDRMGDTTLLYLSERKGAPAIYDDPLTLKEKGYKYLITNNSQEIQKMKENFSVFFENDKFTIFKL